mgnify:CR=1 FL=1
MTNGEKLMIAQQRRQGLGYTEIARKLGMSVNTVKSYCQRNGIKPVGKMLIQSDNACRQCGSMLQHTPGRKKKQFCSDVCRMRWWHEHREMSKTARGAKCAACGREFITDRAQKYCSHACYIAARFGGAYGHETYPSAV